VGLIVKDWKTSRKMAEILAIFILLITFSSIESIILENVQLQNLRSDLCLSVSANTDSNVASNSNSNLKLVLEICDDTNANQKFTFNEENHQFTNSHTNTCVSMTRTARLSQEISLEPCEPSENTQKWNFQKKSQDLYKIAAVKPPHVWEVCIDSQGSDGKGRLVNWVCDKYNDQLYKVIKSEEKFPVADSESERPVKVFIMAEFRSGSNFTSELFNQHSNGFFLFEPFIMIANSTAKGDGNEFLKQSAIDSILEDFFVTCDLPDPSEYLTNYFISQQPNRSRQRLLHSCRNRKICFPSKHSWLKYGVSLANDQCIQSDVQAMKSIRVSGFHQLENVFKQEENIKIIYLTRDPRAMYNSRRKFGVKEATGICKRYKNNYAYLTNETDGNKKSDWLKNRLYYIRYEDLSWLPHHYAGEIYNFLDMDPDEQLNNWIDQNTRNSTGEHYFNTKRDSRKNLQKWRTVLSWEKVQQIQRDCKDMMRVFGYLPLETEEKYRDVNIDYFDKNWRVYNDEVLNSF